MCRPTSHHGNQALFSTMKSVSHCVTNDVTWPFCAYRWSSVRVRVLRELLQRRRHTEGPQTHSHGREALRMQQLWEKVQPQTSAGDALQSSHRWESGGRRRRAPPHGAEKYTSSLSRLWENCSTPAVNKLIDVKTKIVFRQMRWN